MQHPLCLKIDMAHGADDIYVKRNDANICLILGWIKILLGPKNLS